jgi:hypothetical protein
MASGDIEGWENKDVDGRVGSFEGVSGRAWYLRTLSGETAELVSSSSSSSSSSQNRISVSVLKVEIEVAAVEGRDVVSTERRDL